MAFVANVLNSSALRSCIDSDIATVIKAVESDVEWKEEDQSRLCLNAICQYCSYTLLLLFFYLLEDKNLGGSGQVERRPFPRPDTSILSFRLLHAFCERGQ